MKMIFAAGFKWPVPILPARHRSPQGKRSVMRRCLTLVLVLTLLVGCTPAKGDALETPQGHGSVQQFETGTVFTDGMETLEVVDGPIRVLEIRSIADSDGVTSLGFMLRNRDDGRVIEQRLPGYPPTEVPEAIAGEGVQIGGAGVKESWWLLIGYSVDTTGRWERTQLDVVYEKDGVKYTQTFPAKLVVCGSSYSQASCEQTVDELDA